MTAVALILCDTNMEWSPLSDSLSPTNTVLHLNILYMILKLSFSCSAHSCHSILFSYGSVHICKNLDILGWVALPAESKCHPIA